MKNLINKKRRELDTTTNRSVFNKLYKSNNDWYDDYYVKDKYVYEEIKKYDILLESLIENDEYRYYHKSWSGSNMFGSGDYGITWKWYYEYTHTVIRNKKRNWKTWKKKKQWLKN